MYVKLIALFSTLVYGWVNLVNFWNLKPHSQSLPFSLPQEDSDYERENTPPTPPPRKLSRRGASLRLACIGKQQSDENPLMKKIAEPLKIAQTQVSY